jgi:hypothetical protein
MRLTDPLRASLLRWPSDETNPDPTWERCRLRLVLLPRRGRLRPGRRACAGKITETEGQGVRSTGGPSVRSRSSRRAGATEARVPRSSESVADENGRGPSVTRCRLLAAEGLGIVKRWVRRGERRIRNEPGWRSRNRLALMRGRLGRATVPGRRTGRRGSDPRTRAASGPDGLHGGPRRPRPSRRDGRSRAWREGWVRKASPTRGA